MKENRKIRTLLLGLGRIASTLETDPFRLKPCTHAGVLFSPWGKRHFHLKGIHDTCPEKVQSFLDQWSISDLSIVCSEEMFTSFPALKKKKMDLPYDFAIIATPSISHFSIASDLIDSGIKHILVEKPVCLKAEEARILEKKAKRAKAKIWINHERRYHPRYQFIKRMIQSEKYGKVESVRANVFTSAKNPGLAFSKYGGGPLLHDGTHAIDLLFWILGPLHLRYANVKKSNRNSLEDRATAWLQNSHGVEVFLDVSGGRDYFQFEIDIFTTKARFILSNDGFQFFEAKSSKLYQGFRSLHPFTFSEIPKIEKSNAFLGIYREIQENIQEKSHSQEGTIKDNIDILECIESIYQFRRKK